MKMWFSKQMVTRVGELDSKQQLMVMWTSFKHLRSRLSDYSYKLNTKTNETVKLMIISN